MAKKLYLHIKWDETKEKNGSKAGDSGVYDIEITEGCEVMLICHTKRARVTSLTDDEGTLEVPGKGEYSLAFNEITTVRYTDGYQVAGDWVDETITYEIRLSDLSYADYEATLPELEIEDGVLTKSRAKGKTVVIPEGVTKIAYGVFRNSKLCEVVFPSTLKSIGACAFDGCKALTRIELPEGLEEIDYYAFSDSALEEVRFPESLKTVHKDAFYRTPFSERWKKEEE